MGFSRQHNWSGYEDFEYYGNRFIGVMITRVHFPLACVENHSLVLFSKITIGLTSTWHR